MIREVLRGKVKIIFTSSIKNGIRLFQDKKDLINLVIGSFLEGESSFTANSLLERIYRSGFKGSIIAASNIRDDWPALKKFTTHQVTKNEAGGLALSLLEERIHAVSEKT